MNEFLFPKQEYFRPTLLSFRNKLLYILGVRSKISKTHTHTAECVYSACKKKPLHMPQHFTYSSAKIVFSLPAFCLTKKYWPKGNTTHKSAYRHVRWKRRDQTPTPDGSVYIQSNLNHSLYACSYVLKSVRTVSVSHKQTKLGWNDGKKTAYKENISALKKNILLIWIKHAQKSQIKPFAPFAAPRADLIILYHITN